MPTAEPTVGISVRSLRFPEPPGRVLVQQARDQRLIGKSLLEGALLDRFQILGRNPNVQPAILSECGLGVATVPTLGSLGRARRSPLAALHRVQDFFFVRIKFHDRPAPCPSTASWPCDLESSSSARSTYRLRRMRRGI